MSASAQDILQHRASGSWRTLERRAWQLVERTRLHGGESFQPILGGGTRLMLALNHRISDDIDLFVDSPGWLPYVSPRLNDLFDAELAGYNEDNAHVKLRFTEGEIDFVVATRLLPDIPGLWNPPATETHFLMEPPAEVLAKKLFFRGWALTARDLFDWITLISYAPADAIPEDALSRVLASKLDGIDKALMHMVQRPAQHAAWQRIRTHRLPDIHLAAHAAKEQVARWTQLVQDRGAD